MDTLESVVTEIGPDCLVRHHQGLERRPRLLCVPVWVSNSFEVSPNLSQSPCNLTHPFFFLCAIKGKESLCKLLSVKALLITTKARPRIPNQGPLLHAR